MPPKKASTASKKSASTASHPAYQDMIKEAIINLKDRTGSSRQALKKYVLANNNLQSVSESAFTTQFNRALQRGSESGVFSRPKGPSGPVKLAGPKTASDSKPAAKSTTTKAAAKPKTAPAKKAATTKRAAAPKKSDMAPAAPKTKAKKATTTKKAAATKSKANTGTKRKTPAAAPAVEETTPIVLGKTKSGRVTKSTAPQAVAKTIAPKKRTAKKMTTSPKDKKVLTPKKSV